MQNAIDYQLVKWLPWYIWKYFRNNLEQYKILCVYLNIETKTKTIMLTLNFENIANENVKTGTLRLIEDSIKSKYKINPFTVCVNSSVWYINGVLSIPFTSELDAYKFATYCSFLKSSVECVGEIFYVSVNVNL